MRITGDILGLTEKFYIKTGHTNRVLALLNLSKGYRVETNFIIRDNFAFSSKVLAANAIDPEKLAQQLRLEFYQNIIDKDSLIISIDT